MASKGTPPRPAPAVDWMAAWERQREAADEALRRAAQDGKGARR